MSRQFAFALFVLFSAHLTGAASSCDLLFSESGFSSGAISIFLLGIFISVLFISLWYMFGKIIGSAEVEATTQVEIQQVGITLLLAIGLGATLPIMCSIQISEDGISTGVSGIFAQTREKFERAIKATLDAYLDMSNALMDYAQVGSLYAGASLVQVSFLMAPFSAYGVMAQMIAPVSQSVLVAYFSLVFQYVLFTVAQSEAFLMFIPIGLVLRAFPITRKFGGTMAAVGIGMSFIYPLLVVMGFTMIDVRHEGLDSIDPNVYIYPLAAAMLAISIAGMFAAPVIGVTLASVSAGGAALAALGLTSGLSNAIGSDLTALYSSFGSIMMVAFFLPALEAMVLVALVRSLSASLGSEIDLSGIMRAI